MLATISLTSSLKSLKLCNPFLNGAPQLQPNSQPTRKAPTLVPVRAMKQMEGKVVCSTNDKTVSVEVTRLAPHPKYKRRVRIKKKYQAHDPDNKFQVGDFVRLEKCRPISKTKSFLAVPVPVRVRNAKKDAAAKQEADAGPGELGMPLESQVGANV